MNTPERQHTLLLKLSADSREELVAALTQIAIEVDRGQNAGVSVSAGPGYGYVMQTRLNPDMTHDKYFKDLEAHLDELHREEKKQKP